MKFLVRERVFDIGDDYWVTDENDRKVYLVDGKALRIRTTFELQDIEGNVLTTIRRKLFKVRDQMRIERDGRTVATVRERFFDPLKEKLIVEMEDAPDWEVTGDFFGKEYVISDEHGTVAHISRTWFRVRDTYAVDVNTHRSDIGGDPALAISVAVAVDTLTRDDKDEKDDD
ncbi:LURP-one-related/scramblase family protein [Nocardiopsis lambiniae]|uniref:LURP-one-related family protein n=1 Tax=Nocardiopsis lambiniae TaxID=3075539 RepID=A0ABU2M529_9ACTN|nr:LURP-one-related family protein [Nocardiopsis sp. DSM 44743]MDT0327717.1 LURP-one-related family protein [Nocardiopsis sp. DSM 44743]